MDREIGIALKGIPGAGTDSEQTLTRLSDDEVMRRAAKLLRRKKILREIERKMNDEIVALSTIYGVRNRMWGVSETVLRRELVLRGLLSSD